MTNPLAADLDHVVDCTGALWEQLRGGRLFITGGTGFVGRWMLESFARANRELGLGAHVIALSRDPARFAAKAPHLVADPAIEFVAGDMRTFAFPEGNITHVLHMATETNQIAASARPSLEFDTAVEGTRRVLALAAERGVAGMLYTSSGAVYGRQPSDVTHVPEDAGIAPVPNDVGAAYAHGKRAAEFLCAAAHAEVGTPVAIARLFAFVGPHLPMDAGYAVGNFIRDALAGAPIRIGGDGTPMRSYLYAADLAWWLWTVLLAGAPARAYNVGSDAELSIRELADTVARTLDGAAEVEVAKQPVAGAPPRRYVPDVTRAREELGLAPLVTLEDGIVRTAAWYRATKGDSR
ncbi:MAG: NAD-dependent epimerase/dehydratase family protein [Coriobacteriia bacterium]|nr:NAD-dependent epimerase/dehydratase family protein [Coriobacteriia bacterium]